MSRFSTRVCPTSRNVGDYYRHNICSLFAGASGSYSRPGGTNGGPSQNLVEFGALSVSVFATPEVLWQPLSQTQKDTLAATMLSYGDGPTAGSNRKFFNIFILSFFKSQGYAVNEKLLVDYLDKYLRHYALQLKSPIKKASRKARGYDVQIIDNGVYQFARYR